MEQLPNIPDKVSHKILLNFMVELNSSPAKMFGFMVLLSLIASLLFFGFFIFDQQINVSDQTAKEKAKQTSQKTTNDPLLVSNDTQRKQDIEQIARALRAYKVNYAYYPNSLDSLVPEFLFQVPTDPVTKRQYSYTASIDRKGFKLFARLNNGDEYQMSD